MTLSTTWMTPLLAKTLALTTLTVVVGPTTFTPPLGVLIRPIVSPPRVGTSPVATSLAKTVAPEIKFIKKIHKNEAVCNQNYVSVLGTKTKVQFR